MVSGSFRGKLAMPDADALQHYMTCGLRDSLYSGHHQEDRKAIELHDSWPSLIQIVNQFAYTYQRVRQC